MMFERWDDHEPALHAEQPSAHLVLVADDEAPGTARRAVRALHGGLDYRCLEITELLVTEVVTNAVLHGGRGDVEVSFWIRDGALDILVVDTGPGLISPPRLREAGGRGLSLVDQLALHWGSSPEPLSVVWFAVPMDH